MYETSQDTAAEVYETGPPKKPASLSRNSLVTLASSSSRSSSSISIEESTELTEQLHSPLSPANDVNSAVYNAPALQLGSCDPKTSSVPVRSFSMMDLRRLHSPRSSCRLKDQKMTD